MSESEKEVEMITTEPEGGITNMFASVWVKVEVDSESRDSSEPVRKPSKKKKNKKHLKKNKEFKCELCDYTTIYQRSFKHHTVGHKNKLLQCKHCIYSTKYPAALTRHCKIQHKEHTEDAKEVLATFKCDMEGCDYSTYYKWNLKAHMSKHKHIEKHLKCPKCDYETAYRHNFIKHSKTHEDGVIYKCDKCPFVTKYDGHIARHLAKVHREVSEDAKKCDMCDFSTIVKWRVNTHKLRSYQAETLRCAYCTFETQYMCHYKKHKELHFDEISKKKYTRRREPSPPVLQREMPNIPFPEELESQRDQYIIDPNCLDWNNIQVLESEDRERPFQCVMCNYSSKFKAAVQRHFQRHHTGTHNRPYKCCNCDFSTKTKDQIGLHNKRSKADRLLYCPMCEFTTFYKCAFAMHQKCHYRYKCDSCTYSAKQKHDLQKHFVVCHLGKALKCSYCDYTAARKESVLCHETIHTGNKPFKCDHCNYSSVRRYLLVKHIKRMHSEVQTDVQIVTEDKIQSLKMPMSELLSQYQ